MASSRSDGVGIPEKGRGIVADGIGMRAEALITHAGAVFLHGSGLGMSEHDRGSEAAACGAGAADLG